MASHSPDSYYLPSESYYPFVASIALFCIAMGGASYLNGYAFGPKLMTAGLAGMAALLFYLVSQSHYGEPGLQHGSRQVLPYGHGMVYLF